MGLLEEEFEKARRVIVEPKAFFREYEAKKFSDSLRYVAVVTIVLAVMSPIMEWLTGGLMTVDIFFLSALSIYILILIAFFILLALLHILLYLFGSRKDIKTTATVVSYGSTPVMLFGWVPLLGEISPIWSLILYIIAVAKRCEMPYLRATIVVVVMLVTLIILAQIS
jgi:hypothetical protein